jgi:uncharacterized glyoxalase superfamily protein PhnB
MEPHIRHGRGSVRPYLHGPAELPEFLRQVLGAEEIERFEFGPESHHVEMRVGDSTIVIEAGELPDDVEPWTGSIYVYVPDVDAAHRRAIELGAREIAPATDKPYRERQCGFVDAGGNTWWLATFKG